MSAILGLAFFSVLGQCILFITSRVRKQVTVWLVDKVRPLRKVFGQIYNGSNFPKG